MGTASTGGDEYLTGKMDNFKTYKEDLVKYDINPYSDIITEKAIRFKSLVGIVGLRLGVFCV